MQLYAPSPLQPRYIRHLVVDAEGRGDFTTPGAAVTYLDGQTRDVTHHWFIEVRPGLYWTDSAIAIPSHTTWYNPFLLDTSRSWPLVSAPNFRPPAGNVSGAFITIADSAKMIGITADLFTNHTPTAASSLVRLTGTAGYLSNCRLTIWSNASAQSVYACEINAGCTLYASGTLFAIQTPAAQRANATALWAKGPFSIEHGRIHDDDAAGGTGIIYDNTSDSTISFTRFGTHPKSQFTTDINMAANGNLWLLYSKWWTTAGAFAANAKVQQDEV